MNVNPRTISSVSIVLLGLMVCAAWWRVDVNFAAGVAMTGGVMMGNFLAWTWIVRRVMQGTLSEDTGTVVQAAILLGLKFLLIAGTTLGLVIFFPPVSVLVGSSVVVAAIMAHAAAGTLTELQVGEV